MDPRPAPPIVRRHEAMGTEFRVSIIHNDRLYAQQAAQAAFTELDLIEGQLSHFVESSDISRINRLATDIRSRPRHPMHAAGDGPPLVPLISKTLDPKNASTADTLIVGLDTFDCLHRAIQVEGMTGGRFNVAYRSRQSCSTSDAIQLEQPPPTVRVNLRGTQLDLGGIGKGYALDRMARLLEEWDLFCFKLEARASTVLVGEPPPRTDGWPIRVGTGARRRRFTFKHYAVSGSGVAVKGPHVIDPHTRLPALKRHIAWAGTQHAAEADAFSTAFMVMDTAQIKACCRQYAAAGITAFLDDPAAGILRIFSATSG